MASRSSIQLAVGLAQVRNDHLRLKGQRVEAAPSCDVVDLRYEPQFRTTLGFHATIVPFRPDVRLTLLTKSVLPVAEPRYLDALEALRFCLVLQVSIEAAQNTLTSPHARPYDARIRLIDAVAARGVAVGRRLDPIIPGVTDQRGGMARIIGDAASAGARRVTASCANQGTVRSAMRSRASAGGGARGTPKGASCSWTTPWRRRCCSRRGASRSPAA